MPRKPNTARQIAHAGVSEYFDDISSRLDLEEFGMGLRLESLVDAVEPALSRERKELVETENEDAEDRESRLRSRAAEAGYMIGVEVGLRLRGGVR